MHDVQSTTELFDTFASILLQKPISCDLENKLRATTERNALTGTGEDSYSFILTSVVTTTATEAGR